MKKPNPDPSAPAPAPPVVPQEELPLVVSFALHKKGTKWAALALETQGLKVIRIMVVDMDPNKEHIKFVIDRSQHELFTYGNSPFAPEMPTAASPSAEVKS